MRIDVRVVKTITRIPLPFNLYRMDIGGRLCIFDGYLDTIRNP